MDIPQAQSWAAISLLLLLLLMIGLLIFHLLNELGRDLDNRYTYHLLRHLSQPTHLEYLD